MAKKYKDTKYYLIGKDGNLTKIEINRNTWVYAQIQASINYAYGIHNVDIPKYVLVERYYDDIDRKETVTLTLISRGFRTPQKALNWANNRIYIKDELDRQARANSNEYSDGTSIEYEFKIM